MFFFSIYAIQIRLRLRSIYVQMIVAVIVVDLYSFAQGIRLHYVEAGDKSKPLMVFVHGFPEFWYCWRHQITEFSKDYWFENLTIFFSLI